MDSTGCLQQNFFVILTDFHVASNQMKLPAEFVSKNGDRLPPEFVLKLRTGYQLPVDFDKRSRVLKGLSRLYRDFDLRSGHVLIFEYYGRFDLNLYVVGGNSSEIAYPLVLHHFQNGHPLSVHIRDCHWKFVMFLDPDERVIDEIETPQAFVDHYNGEIDKFLNFMISNGQNFAGKYSVQTNKITGLRGMCNLLGLDDLNSFHMLLFTYYGQGLFQIAAFNENLVEILFSGTPMSGGDSSNPDTLGGRFEITMKRFHIETHYNYGVDIPVQFKSLWHFWGRTDYINVYSGTRSWKLKNKIRENWKRATIHDGWLEFRNGLGLEIGDVCIFECPPNSFNHFTVRVVKRVKKVIKNGP